MRSCAPSAAGHWVPGSYEDAVDESRRLAAAPGAVDGNVDGPYVDAVLAGHGVVVAALRDALNEPPAQFWIPVGNGTTVIAVHRQLRQLGSPTVLQGVCSAGNNPVVTSWPGTYRMLPPDGVTTTDHNQPLVNWHALQGPEAMAAIAETGGAVHGVDDDQLRHAEGARRHGAYPTAAGSVALAGLLAQAQLPAGLPGGTHVLLLSGRSAELGNPSGEPSMTALAPTWPAAAPATGTTLLFSRARVTRADERVFLGKLAVLAALTVTGAVLALRAEPVAVAAGVLLLAAMYTHAVELQHQCLHHSAFGARSRTGWSGNRWAGRCGRLLRLPGPPSATPSIPRYAAGHRVLRVRHPPPARDLRDAARGRSTTPGWPRSGGTCSRRYGPLAERVRRSRPGDTTPHHHRTPRARRRGAGGRRAGGGRVRRVSAAALAAAAAGGGAATFPGRVARAPALRDRHHRRAAQHPLDPGRLAKYLVHRRNNLHIEHHAAMSVPINQLPARQSRPGATPSTCSAATRSSTGSSGRSCGHDRNGHLAWKR